MLRIVLEGDEIYDEEKNEFSWVGGITLDFEHSLLSLSKWESKYQKPFLAANDKTAEETFGYLDAMLLTPGVDPGVLRKCSSKTLDQIQEYIQSSQSATTFGEMPTRRGPSEVITSELIYYWMVAFKIPFECETWHINRLFSLIRICNIKNAPPKKMSKMERVQQMRELNAKRKAEMGTSG